MANIRGRIPLTDKRSSSSLAFEEFVPPSAWTEEATCHYLLVDLPGFKREELKLQVDNQTHITVSGERQVAENKYMRFEQTFELPKDVDAGKITGKLEGEILYISVPKRAREDTQGKKNLDNAGEKEKVTRKEPSADENSDHKNEKNHTVSDGYNEEEEKRASGQRGSSEGSGDENWRLEGDLLGRAIWKLQKNKGIVVTALLAFSLGVLVSQRFQSSGQ